MRTYFQITRFRDQAGGLLIEARATETDGVPITRADIVRDAAPLLQGGTLGLQIMNRPVDAGVVTHASFADGVGQIAALVTDPDAIRKIKARVFKGLSAVASPLKRLADGVISRLSLEEISLVDRPFDPDEVQTIWRAAAQPLRIAASGSVAPKAGPAIAPTDQQVRDELAKMTPEERALTITKAALRLPIKT